MTWTEPTSRSTGDLITAAIWNQDVVGNTQYLHDRVVRQWLMPYNPLSVVSDGDWSVYRVGAAYTAAFHFSVGDDFEALTRLVLLIIPDTSETIQFDLDSDYGAEGEDYNQHSESLVNQTLAVIDDDLTLIDVSGVFTDLAAGDFCALNFGSDTDYIRIAGMLLEYTRL
jgi:hypothetical protein